VSAGTEFVAELLAAMPSAEAQKAARSVLQAWEGHTVRLPAAGVAERQRRAQAAALLLKAGVDRAQAIGMIAERFGISERHARRIVASGQDVSAGVRGACDRRGS
jgi:hypothetical protein